MIKAPLLLGRFFFFAQVLLDPIRKRGRNIRDFQRQTCINFLLQGVQRDLALRCGARTQGCIDAICAKAPRMVW